MDHALRCLKLLTFQTNFWSKDWYDVHQQEVELRRLPTTRVQELEAFALDTIRNARAENQDEGGIPLDEH